MTPDKRLDQVEPILADVAQKTDRLIESNGQILEIATRADSNAAIAARGVADLTIEMRQRFEQVDQRFEQIDQQFEQVNQQFKYVDQRFDQQQAQIDNLRQEMQQGFQDVNQKFTQFEQTQQQILSLLLDRLT